MLDSLKNIYERHYKKLMLIPLAIIILSAVVLGVNYGRTGEFVNKDVSLKGGLLITVSTDKSIDIEDSEKVLADALDAPVKITELNSLGTGGRIGYTFEIAAGADKDIAVEKIKSVIGGDPSKDYTTEEISPSLGETFWSSTIKAILIAFLFMSLVVFAYFRKLAPSGAIVLAAVTDFLAVLAIMNLLGIYLSTAGVAALLMLIGYSVDSDVLLTTRVIKHTEGSTLSRVYSAIKTGLTMEMTTLAALIVLYIVAPASTLKTIALVLIIGIVIDLFSTWLMNAGILRWYMEKNG